MEDTELNLNSFYLTYVASVLGFSILFFSSKIWAPRFWPTLFGKYRANYANSGSENGEDAQSLLFHSTLIATPLGFILAPMIYTPGLQLVRDYLSGSVNLLTKPCDPWMVCATAIALGHCTVDTCFLLFYKAALLKQGVYKSSYWYQMVGHHFGCLYVWTTLLIAGKGTGYILFCVCTEVTLPLLEIRWFLQEAISIATPTAVVMLNTAYMINGILLLLLFTVVRVFPIPFIIQAVVFSTVNSFAEFTWYEYLIAQLSFPWPLILNFYWWLLLLRGAAKSLGLVHQKSPKH